MASSVISTSFIGNVAIGAGEYCSITESGAISGILSVAGNSALVYNAGVLAGDASGISVDATTGITIRLINSGSILGFVQFAAATSNAVVENSGAMLYGLRFEASTGTNYLTNSGVIDRVLLTSGGSGNRFVNSGDILASVGNAIQMTNTGLSFLTNSGTISSIAVAINITPDLYLVNSGVIQSTSAYAISHVNNTSFASITNSGLIVGSIQLSQGDDYLRNFNGEIAGSVYMGAGGDVVDNRNGLISGSVSLEAGIDTFFGGDVAVDVFGGDGDDYLYGGAGKDTLSGGADNDLIEGEDGGDTLSGDVGNDTLSGQVGDDVLFGGSGADTLDGGDGFDLVTYYAFAVTVDLEDASLSTGDATGDTFVDVEGIVGSIFSDFLYGDGAANLLRGSSGFDRLEGREGADRLEGGVDGDTLIGGGGADFIDGGSGIDVADYSASAEAVSVWLTGAVGVGGDAAGDTLIRVENVVGSAGDDSLFGTSQINTLTGNDGDDYMSGGAGADALLGGDGADILRGGTGGDFISGDSGNDTADYTGSLGSVQVNLGALTAAGGDAQGDYNFFSIENLIGSSLDDTLTGDSGANALSGGSGADMLSGGGGADALNGGLGIDTADYSTSATRVRVNLTTGVALDADAQGDTFVAIENLTGTAFNDVLTGSAGANVLTGGGGNDQLNGGGGADSLTGNAGADAFVFTTALGAGNVDLVFGFSVADDVFWIDNAVFTGLSNGTLAVGAFQTGAAATEADDRIIYDPATGLLMFDADGNGAGAAVQFAGLSAGLAMTNSDFLVT